MSDHGEQEGGVPVLLRFIKQNYVCSICEENDQWNSTRKGQISTSEFSGVYNLCM
jgi:hypothetical protein